MNVVIIGAGYVGLTTGAVLAYLGHDVTCVDKDPVKIQMLSRLQAPIREPGLQQLLSSVGESITFSLEIGDAVRKSDVVIIAVGTPSKANGEADLHFVEEAAAEIAKGFEVHGRYVVAVKSTVPVGTNRRVRHVIDQVLTERGIACEVAVVSNPEFLREGLAIKDTLYPDRVVIGSDSPSGTSTLEEMYAAILNQTFDAPTFCPAPETRRIPGRIITDPTSAELIKYAANAFLAVKISYINEIAGLCDLTGADVKEVARGIGSDPRIGSMFLSAGLGWGGSCLPKDTAALVALGSEYGYHMPIVEASRLVNSRQVDMVIQKLQSALKTLRGRTICVLGLAFKPDTDDVRESQSIRLIRKLSERGAHIRAHDPLAIDNAAKALVGSDAHLVPDPYEAASGADAAVLTTEWADYRELDLHRLRAAIGTPVIMDCRNFWEPESVEKAGFVYMGVGRR